MEPQSTAQAIRFSLPGYRHARLSKIYKISSPFQQSALQDIQFVQAADIVTLVHPDYVPQELKRFGATNWTISDVIFGSSIAAPSGGSLSGVVAGTTVRQYAVTAITDQGEESDSMHVGSNNCQVPTASAPIVISWTPVSGASFYKVYFSNNTNSVYGFIGNARGAQFSDDASVTPDYTNTPVLINNPFPSAGNYPSTVGFVQQRRAFGNTDNNPVGVWMSSPGLYSNMNIHVIPQDSDAVIETVTGAGVNAIQHILELKFMLALSAAAEFYVHGDGNGVVTPAQFNAAVQSQYGSKSLPVLTIGDSIVFAQALGTSVRDLAFDFSIDGYRGNDLTIFASHLFKGYQIDDWCYQQIQDSIIWAARSDGVLLSCTYLKEQQILAWTRNDFTNGKVENICAIPENGQTAVYMTIARVIGGQTVRYVERLSSTVWTDNVNDPPVQNDPINASYMDAFLRFDGRNTASTQMTLGSLITITTNVNDGIGFKTKDDNYATYRLAVIAPGTYDVNALATAISTAMNAQYAGGYIAVFSDSRFVIAANNDFRLLFNNTDPNPTRRAGVTLGYGTNTLQSVGDELVAANAPASSFTAGSLAYQQTLSLTSDTAFFGSNAVGNQVFIEDEEWIQTQGKKGSQIRLTIQSVTNSQAVLVTPSEEVPLEFQFNSTTLWSYAVNQLSGLSHLEGQEVSVWADRFVVGSPLNSQVSTVYTVTNGTITVDKPYSVICVGLPMKQDIESLDLESYFGETMLAKRKRVSSLAAYFYNTRTVFCGSQNPDNNEDNTNDDPLFDLYEEKDGTAQATYDVAPELLTAQDYIIVPSRWTKSGRVFMRNVDPSPFNLLAFAPRSEDPVQTPYKRP